MIHRMLSVMYLEWDIEWESSMVVAIFTVLLVGFILGGSTVYLIENHFRTKEMNKIYKLTESLINGNDLDDSDIGMETLYSKTANQLIRLQEVLEGRRKEAEKSRYEIQKLISEIAHQLRTPLANIKNYTELLQESLDETQEGLNIEYMKDLQTSEEQLCFLVESFIKTARLEQGIIQVHMQKENLVETILNALGQIQKKAEEITEIAEEKNAVMKDTATKTEKAEHTEKTDSDANLKDSTQEVPKPQTILPFVDSLDNLEKFQDIVGDIMKRALQENNVELENRIADSVLKEMEILMKIQEKREEERYRNLDETIRSFQHNRQMVAATREKESHKKWFRIFK